MNGFHQKNRQFDKKPGLGRLNQSIEAFLYCIVGAEVNIRSSIVGRK